MTTNEFTRRPGFPMTFRAARKHVRMTFAGEVVVDSIQAMTMEEDGHQPVYYFPRHEVRMELLTPTARSSR